MIKIYPLHKYLRVIKLFIYFNNDNNIQRQELKKKKKKKKKNYPTAFGCVSFHGIVLIHNFCSFKANIALFQWLTAPPSQRLAPRASVSANKKGWEYNVCHLDFLQQTG